MAIKSRGLVCYTIVRMSATRSTIDYLWVRSESHPGVHVFRSPTDRDVTAHNHVFHEIVYIESGSADHVTAGEPCRLRPGDLIVIQPGVWHAYERPRDFVIINCLFDSRLLRRFGSMLQGVQGSLELFRKRVRNPDQHPPMVLHARPAERAMLMTHIEGMMNEQGSRRDGWQLAVTSGLLQVLVFTSRLHVGETSVAPRVRLADRTEQAVMDAVTHLEANYTQPFRLAVLAKSLHLSPGHLSRGFSRRMGMGMVEFANRLRIEEACRLLQWTDEPIKVIAHRVGFRELPYFSRCFKGLMSQSPRDYRNARQNFPPTVRP